jgi:D-alanine-D-alanine ligase-like ATP-grasp enzyme
MDKRLIAVILGGASSERKVSLKAGSEIYNSINKDEYDVILLDGVTEEQLKTINCNDGSCRMSFETYFTNQNNRRPDYIFVALHKSDGENSLIKELLSKQKQNFFFMNDKTTETSKLPDDLRNIFDQTHG